MKNIMKVLLLLGFISIWGTNPLSAAENTYISPEGIRFFSNSEKWDEQKLKELYEDFKQIGHGEEWSSFRQVILNIAESKEGHAGIYSGGSIRIYDVDSHSRDEILAIMTHEYGHHFTRYWFNQIEGDGVSFSSPNSKWFKIRKFGSDNNITERKALEILAEDYRFLYGIEKYNNSINYAENVSPPNYTELINYWEAGTRVKTKMAPLGLQDLKLVDFKVEPLDGGKFQYLISFSKATDHLEKYPGHRYEIPISWDTNNTVEMSMFDLFDKNYSGNKLTLYDGLQEYSIDGDTVTLKTIFDPHNKQPWSLRYWQTSTGNTIETNDWIPKGIGYIVAYFKPRPYSENNSLKEVKSPKYYFDFTDPRNPKAIRTPFKYLASSASETEINKIKENAPIAVFIDNVEQEYEVTPRVSNGRTLVPMRSIFESLGAKVEWIPQERKIRATKGNTVVMLQIGSSEAKINQTQVKLEAPPNIIQGRTLVPLRFIAEALETNVNWDANLKTVYINSEVR